MLVNNPAKLHKKILNGSQGTERTKFVTDGQTTRTKAICLRPLKGGDINTKYRIIKIIKILNQAAVRVAYFLLAIRGTICPIP